MKPQLPELQVARPLAGTEHARPQAPQLAGAARSVSHPLDGSPSQFANPGLQANPQEPPAHAALALVGVAQARPHAPQCAALVRTSASHPLLASPSQSAKPARQATPQFPPRQTGVALARAGHVSHRAPQLSTAVSSAQIAPQTWNPASQAIPQVPTAQTARPFVGTGQTPSQPPQCCPSVCASMQLIPQRVLATPLHPLTQRYAPANSWQRGAGSWHRVPHAPQVRASSRRASQPLVGSPSQSA